MSRIGLHSACKAKVFQGGVADQENLDAPSSNALLWPLFCSILPFFTRQVDGIDISFVTGTCVRQRWEEQKPREQASPRMASGSDSKIPNPFHVPPPYLIERSPLPRPHRGAAKAPTLAEQRAGVLLHGGPWSHGLSQAHRRYHISE